MGQMGREREMETEKGIGLVNVKAKGHLRDHMQI